MRGLLPATGSADGLSEAVDQRCRFSLPHASPTSWPEPVTSGVARASAPFSWWTVERLAVGMTGGVTFYYRVGERQPLRDVAGRWRRDSYGRSALEAFGALPIACIYRDLAAGRAAWLALPESERDAILARDPARESRRWLAALKPLVTFVQTFGPMGFDWPRTMQLNNSAAERAEAKVAKLELERTLLALGKTASEATLASRQVGLRRRRDWQVKFLGPGSSLPEVTEIRRYPTLAWDKRVHLGDDSLPQDFLGPVPGGPLWHEQDDLLRILDLVRALSAKTFDPHRIRNAIARLPGVSMYSTEEPTTRDPVGLYWQDASRGRPTSGAWNPMKEHPSSVDWRQAGRLALATFLSQLSWTSLGVGLDKFGVPQTRWNVLSPRRGDVPPTPRARRTVARVRSWRLPPV